MTAAARVAIVTGGTNAIGAEISAALARGGTRVVVADADLGGAEAIASGLDGSGHCGLMLDVTSEQSVVDLFEGVESQFGPIATLVCVPSNVAAESGAPQLIASTTLDAWIEAEARTARATFLCVRELLRHRMEARVSDGRIVTITGPAALTLGVASDAANATSAAGVFAIARIAALEAGPLGITVNAIIAGPRDAAATRTSIAEAVCFLSSPGGRHITGAAFAVDGGGQFTL